MSDGLRVNVIPMLDESEFEKLIRTANEKLSATSFNLTGSGSDAVTLPHPQASPTTTTTVTAPSGAPVVDVSGSAVTVTKETAQETAQTFAEEHFKAEKETEKEPDSKKNFLERLSQSLDRFIGTYQTETATGSGWKDRILTGVKEVVPNALTTLSAVMVAGFEVTSAILEKVMKSSKILQEVWSLFDNTFNMILTPIGSIIAIEMMPMIRKMYEVIGDWMSKAMDIYDKDGWVGIIISALEVGVKLMWEALKGFTDIFIGIIVDSFKYIFTDIFNLDILVLEVQAIAHAVGKIMDNLGGMFGGAWDWVTDNVPFLATGGIVTAPTPAVFGESGSEAVIPLDYLDSFLLNKETNAIELATPIITSTVVSAISNANAVASTNDYSSRTATNVYNTINVYSDDPQHVGNELKRMLDKSVGKVLSLY